MSTSIRTALVFMTPDVENRLPLDAYPPGTLGAHLTVLSPFHQPSAVDRYRRALVEIVSTFTLPELVLDRVGSFDGTLYLGSSTDDEIVRFTDEVIAMYPEMPPYGRPGIETIPHVTLPTGTTTADASRLLGMTVQLGPLLWVAEQPDGWRNLATFETVGCKNSAH